MPFGVPAISELGAHVEETAACTIIDIDVDALTGLQGVSTEDILPHPVRLVFEA
jgi:hypothetical protein